MAHIEVHTIVTTERKDWCCDFCGAPQGHLPKVTVFKAAACEELTRSPVTGTVFKDLDGDWLACAECAVLIRANDMNAVVERSVEELIQKFGVPEQERAELREHVRAIQGVFWAGVKGETAT